MKFEQEPLCEGLYKREEGDGNNRSFVYDITDLSVPKEREHIVHLGFRDSIEEIIDSLQEARRSSNDIFIGFLSGLAVFKVTSNEECCVVFREMIESVKAIKIVSRSVHNRLIDATDIISQSIKFTSTVTVLEIASNSLVELSLIGYVLTDELALTMIRSLKHLDGLEYLSFRGTGCSSDTFAKLMNGLVDILPSVRYLDIASNQVSRDGGEKIKDLIIGHEKLVYLDIGSVVMDYDGLDLILDGCEISGRMQVIVVENTLACTDMGMRKLEERMMSGKLCLLGIQFGGTASGVLISRLRPYFARNAREREGISRIQHYELSQTEKPEIIETIARGYEGIENMYKCLVSSHNDLLLEVINGRRTDE
jgi:hypothetical protein